MCGDNVMVSIQLTELSYFSKRNWYKFRASLCKSCRDIRTAAVVIVKASFNNPEY